jgi:hypothetical protein
MKWLWQTLWIISVILLLPQVQQDLFGWCFWLAKRLIVQALNILPPSHRERYEDEWLGELDQLRGRNLSALIYAIGIRCWASRLSRTLGGVRLPARWLLPLYVTIVSVIGFVFIGWLLMQGGVSTIQATSGLFWLVALVAFIDDLFPVIVNKRFGGLLLTSSDVFYAVLALGWDAAVAVPTIAIISIITDLVARKNLAHMLFNAAQHSLASGAAIFALHLPLPIGSGPVNIFSILLATSAFVVVNSSLVHIVVALQTRCAMRSVLRQILPHDLVSEGLLLAVAPLIPLIHSLGISLIPVLLTLSLAIKLSTKYTNDHRLPGLPLTLQ